MIDSGGYGLGKRKQEYLPLVSVITPVFNGAALLQDCIKSVSNQEYSNIEHLFIDGGSTDGTLAILKDHEDKIAYWHSEPDRGIYDAMNKGVKLASGDWLFFLGVDDRLLPGFSEMCKRLNDSSYIYYGHAAIEGRHSNGQFSAYQIAKLNISHQCIFYPKEVFKSYSYNVNYTIRADHALNIACLGDKRFEFRYFPITVAKYALGGFSSNFDDPPFFNDRPGLILKNLGFFAYLRFKMRTLRHWLKGRKS